MIDVITLFYDQILNKIRIYVHNILSIFHKYLVYARVLVIILVIWQRNMEKN